MMFDFSNIGSALQRTRQGLPLPKPAAASDIVKKAAPAVLPAAPARTVPLAPPVAAPPQGNAPAQTRFQPDQIRDYRNNRVNDEVDFARDQYVRQGQGEDGKYKRDWKNVLVNALLGAGMGAANGGGVGGALGGAAAAGLGSAINPMAGREFNFERAQAPGMYQALDREQQAQKEDLDTQYRQAQIGELGARTGERAEDREYERQVRQAALARLPIEQQQSDEKHATQMELLKAQKAERESNVSLRQARAKAAELGKPQPVDLLDNDGAIRTYYAYPNGDIKPLGESGKAAMQENKDKNAMNRVRFQEGSRTGRAAMSQTGQNSRLNQRLGAEDKLPTSGKVVPPGMIEKFMKQTGRSRQEAERMAKEAGYSIR